MIANAKPNIGFQFGKSGSVCSAVLMLGRVAQAMSQKESQLIYKQTLGASQGPDANRRGTNLEGANVMAHARPQRE